MKIKELASTFLSTRKRRDDQKRYIDYDLKNQLQILERDSKHTVEDNLRIIQFKSEIEASKLVLDGLNEELAEVKNELEPMLREVKATFLNPLDTHVEGDTWFSTWLDDNGEVQSSGLTSRL